MSFFVIRHAKDNTVLAPDGWAPRRRAVPGRAPVEDDKHGIQFRTIDDARGYLKTLRQENAGHSIVPFEEAVTDFEGGVGHLPTSFSPWGDA